MINKVNKSLEYTHIRVSTKTQKELKTFGTMGESFEDVIKRLIFIARNGKVADKEAKTNKVEKLSDKQMIQIARLGSMRTWSLRYDPFKT